MNTFRNKKLRQLRYRAYETRRNIIELSNFVEGSLLKELKHRRKTARVKVDAIDDEEERMFLEANHKELIEQVGEAFSILQRYALFVTAIATVERNFVLLAQAAKEILHINSDFNDRKPGVILRAIEYLEIQAGITNRSKKAVKLIEDLVSIRNCIVHSEGCIYERNEAEMIRIRKFITEIPTIEETSGKIIKLLPGFVENMTHSIYTFFQVLHSAVENKAQQIDPADQAQAPGR